MNWLSGGTHEFRTAPKVAALSPAGGESGKPLSRFLSLAGSFARRGPICRARRFTRRPGRHGISSRANEAELWSGSGYVKSRHIGGVDDGDRSCHGCRIGHSNVCRPDRSHPCRWRPGDHAASHGDRPFIWRRRTRMDPCVTCLAAGCRGRRGRRGVSRFAWLDSALGRVETGSDPPLVDGADQRRGGGSDGRGGQCRHPAGRWSGRGPAECRGLESDP